MIGRLLRRWRPFRLADGTAPFPAPVTCPCDDCGEQVTKGTPALFNAAQELVHADCGEELNVVVAVPLWLLFAGTAQEVAAELAEEAALRKAAKLVSPLRVTGTSAGPEGVRRYFTCRAIPKAGEPK